MKNKKIKEDVFGFDLNIEQPQTFELEEFDIDSIKPMELGTFEINLEEDKEDKDEEAAVVDDRFGKGISTY